MLGICDTDTPIELSSMVRPKRGDAIRCYCSRDADVIALAMQALLCTVFGITGSTSMYLVRPVLPKIGIKGSWKEGPWSYRIGSFVLVSPVYTLILLTVGSLAGRHNFFAAMARKMW